MKIRIIVFLFTGLLVAADTPDDLAKKEREKFQGTWVVENAEGKAPAKVLEQMKGSKIIFSDNKIQIVPKGQDKRPASSYKLDPTKKPKEIDLIQKGPGGRTMISQAVYQLKGDELKIRSGIIQISKPKEGETNKVLKSKRPARLDAKEGILLILKKAKQ